MAAWLWIGLLGCSGDDPAPMVSFLDGPTVADNPAAGLTAWLTASLDQAVALEVEVAGPERTFTLHSPAATDHDVLVLGLHADTTHELVVRAVDAAGRTLAERATTWTTAALPLDFFPLEGGPVDLARMEPGITLAGFGGYLTAVDPQGHPVWYLAVPGAIHEATRLPNGNLLVLANRTTVTEFDLAGGVVNQWRAARTTDLPAGSIAVDVDALHHDVTELPDGNLVSLSVERRWIEDYPSSEVNRDAPPRPTWVAGDVVVEFTRAGEVQASWSLLDRLDPLRIGYDAVDGDYWGDFAPWGGEDTKDWSHGNSVSYDPASDTLLAGLRHQDAVVALSRRTGEVRWILAPQANWSDAMLPLVLAPEDPASVPYHLHGAKFTPAGTVMLFDNGNNRASPYERPVEPQDNFSRAIEYEIDVEAGIFREIWSFGEEMVPPHYAGSLGDADPLPVTDNVLITFGNLANPALGGVRLLEVTRAGEPVWSLGVTRPGATTFRSQRIQGMIPGL